MQAGAICEQFVPVGDDLFRHIAELEALGFSAFRPTLALAESYCESVEECELHRRCTIESAKALLGRPWPFKADGDEKARFYKSAFIEELKLRRDKDLGVSASEFVARHPEQVWRLEVDPCKRRLMELSLRSDPSYLARESHALESRRVILDQETVRHTHGPGPGIYDPFDHMEALGKSMQHELIPLGFKHDSLKSRADYPVFSKSIGGGWDLCWALDDSRVFSRGPASGICKLVLDLRSARLKGSIEGARSGHFLVIRHDQLIPGFHAYAAFSSFSGLELVVKAHVSLYRLIGQTIERAIQRVLA